MAVTFHRGIQIDIRAALAFYEAAGGRSLSERFFSAAEETVEKVIRHPQGFHFLTPKLRRASLESFPYHFLFDQVDLSVRFLVLRHDKLHPSFRLHRR